MRAFNLRRFFLFGTCESCPEQYEVFDEVSGSRVAYFRLRHGHFYAAITGPPLEPDPNLYFQILERFYEVDTIGDGEFIDSEEREKHLTEACRLLRLKLEENPPGRPS